MILYIINRLTLFTFLIFYVTTNFAQQPTQEWVARIPGPTNDFFGPFLEVDNQGNSYIAGAIEVNDTPKVFCAKYNTDGVQLWSALYIYPSEAYIRTSGLALDNSGNAYVIADQSPAYYLPSNGLIVKFNSSNGSPAWVKRYIGQYGWGAFRDIQIDRLNNIYVVGWTDSSHLVIRYNTNGDSVWVRKYRPPWGVREVTRACSIDDSLNIIFTGQRRFYYPPYGWYDSLLIAKYSSGGILRWESVYAYNLLGSDIGTKITNDQSGNSFIGGVTTISGYSVYLTLKFDLNGSRQWAKIYYPPGSVMNDIYGIALNRINNELYVSGYSVINSVGSAATIKYNTATGDSAWVRRGFGVPGSSSAWDIEVDSSGNPYITGSSMGVSSSDLSTLKYNSLGNSEWLMRYNGPFNGGDGGRALEINQNNVYVLGYSQSSSQISDYIIIKYNQISGINPISNTIPLSFNLEQNYPNPFNPNTKINFSIPKNGLVQLRVYDILGREVTELVNEEVSPGEYSISWDASMYSSGIYIYRIEAGDFAATKKMVLLK
jgi:hypothetical protein